MCCIFASSAPQAGYLTSIRMYLASFVLQHLADGRQPHLTAVTYIKQENRSDALQAKSLAMAFSKLFS